MGRFDRKVNAGIDPYVPTGTAVLVPDDRIQIEIEEHVIPMEVDWDEAEYVLTRVKEAEE
jgi:hypothetical protein